MRSDFKLQKLFLLLILSLSTLSGCIAPAESANSPAPDKIFSNEKSQASGAESSNSFEVSSNPLSPQESTELEKKWDEFLTALSTNITDESYTNFKAVQTKAQELKTLAIDRPDLSGFRTYLSDAVIYYKDLEQSADSIYRNFNNQLVKDGLGFRDLAIEGDVITLLSNENKQSTAQQVVDKLNAKYRSLLVSSPEPFIPISPSKDSLLTEDNKKNYVAQFFVFVIALSVTMGSFIALNKKFNVFPALNNYLFLPPKLQESESPTVLEQQIKTLIQANNIPSPSIQPQPKSSEIS